MNFQLDQNTIVLALVVFFIAWYFYQQSKESFKSKRGIQSGRGSTRVGKRPLEVIAPPPPPPQIVVQAPPPPPVVVAPPVVVTSGDGDFAGLL